MEDNNIIRLIEGKEYPRIIINPAEIGANHLILSGSGRDRNNRIPVLPNSTCRIPAIPIQNNYYYKRNQKLILYRSLWMPPPPNQYNLYRKLGYGVRLPRIPKKVLRGTCDGSYKSLDEKENGGFGGVVSDHKGEVILSVEGRSKFHRNSVYHEIEGVQIIILVCLKFRTIITKKLHLFTDCQTAIRFLKAGYVFTDDDEKIFGKYTIDLAIRVRELILFCGYKLKFSYREQNYYGDHCSKAYPVWNHGYVVRFRAALTQTTLCFEDIYMTSTGMIKFRKKESRYDFY